MVLKTKPLDNEKGYVDAEQLATLGLDPKPSYQKSVYQDQHNQWIVFWIMPDNGQRVFC